MTAKSSSSESVLLRVELGRHGLACIHDHRATARARTASPAPSREDGKRVGQRLQVDRRERAGVGANYAHVATDGSASAVEIRPGHRSAARAGELNGELNVILADAGRGGRRARCCRLDENRPRPRCLPRTRRGRHRKRGEDHGSDPPHLHPPRLHGSQAIGRSVAR